MSLQQGLSALSLQAYKDVSMLLETQMKRAPASKKTRLNVFYVLSSICRQSKKRFKEKDKYGKLSRGFRLPHKIRANMPQRQSS